MSRTVDLHHHVIPDFYWEASNENGNAAGGITPPRWSFDAAIAYLDEARIDVAVPSISTPGVHFGDDAAARNLARQVNEYLVDIKRDRPDRFGAFAALPLPDVEGSLDQIAYAFDVLELKIVAPESCTKRRERASNDIASNRRVWLPMSTGTRPKAGMSPRGGPGRSSLRWPPYSWTIAVFEIQVIFASTTDRGQRAPLLHAGRGTRQAPTRRRTTGLTASRLEGTPERTLAEER
jgi:hypothetical protein